MKRSIITRLVTFLCMIAFGSPKTFAQLATQTAGSEEWLVLQNSKITVTDEEYEYFASANISIFVGANEKWEAPKLIDGKYYLRSQGNPGILNDERVKNDKGAVIQTNPGYISSQKCLVLPNTGNYFHFRFHTKGVVTISFSVTFASAGTKNFYLATPLNKTVIVSSKNLNYTSTQGSAISSATLTSSTEGATWAAYSDNGYYQLSANKGVSTHTVSFEGEAGEDYYIWVNSTEEFALGGFKFQVDPSYIFTPWTPNVHEQVELGKDPNVSANVANSVAPTGVKDITFMYGGWLNHPNAVKATKWDETNKKWSFESNGTEANQYTINGNTYTDKWAEATKELSSAEKLTTLDGYDSYTAGCGNIPTNELGQNFTIPSLASVKAIPCRGTYYKFEPAKDGFLTVYVRQSNSNNPVYLVDESGMPQESVDYRAGQSGVTITEGKDLSYTTSALSACRYSFYVNAGKTYVLFQNNEALGFYGFTFGANETEDTNVAINQANGFVWEKKIPNAHVTLTQKIKNGQWNAICFPFSMTEKQVRETFGEDTRISEFKNIADEKANFSMHYYQLITAGKPCLIKPAGTKVTPENVTLAENQYYISGVTVSAETPMVIVDENNSGFSFVGTYQTETMPINSHFLGANDGKLYYITKEKTIGGLKAYLKAESGASMQGAKLSAAFDEDDSVTGIEDLTFDNSDKHTNKFIYNLNGQVVGSTNIMSSLGKGIYIVGGKKIIIK